MNDKILVYGKVSNIKRPYKRYKTKNIYFDKLYSKDDKQINGNTLSFLYGKRFKTANVKVNDTVMFTLNIKYGDSGTVYYYNPNEIKVINSGENES